jgi:hypothetical protein
MKQLSEKLFKIFNVSRIVRSLSAGLIILLFSIYSVSGQKGYVVSPHYLLPEFTKGKVLLKSGTPRELKMNYNIITEEMIFEYPGKYLALTNIETIDTVYILDRKFIPSGKIFQELLVNGRVPLFAKYTCIVTPPGKPSGYGSTSQTSSITVVDQLFTKGKGIAYELKLPDDYVITPITEFLLQKGSELVKIYNIKQVIKVFPEKGSQIKEYSKNNKTDFKKQNDVISLIAFCNK